MSLNPDQEKAVKDCGIQLILAGPGSGKTRVITEKVLHLLDMGTQPSEILALTFSEKAAAEMADRIEEVRPHLNLDISTFHSFCLNILRENVLASGTSVSGGVISRTNQLVWGLRNIDAFGFEHIKVGNNAAEVIKAVIDGTSAFRDELITPDDLGEYLERKQLVQVDDKEREYLLLLADLLKVYRAYGQYKRDENLIDFDDMVHGAVNLFKTNPAIRAIYRSRYRYILVDEFQDTNFAQLELVKEIAGDNLCVVGDDDQTIYRFRGAYLTNIQDFKEWAAGHAETLLGQNYRNSKSILALATQLMANAPNRQHKKLFTEKPDGGLITVAVCGNEEGEAEYVALEIGKLVGTPFYSHHDEKERPYEYRDFAVLCRSRADGQKFQAALRRHSIPCRYKGDVEFMRLPVVRDMAAYLRTIDNPLTAGISLNRIMKACAVPETEVQKINAAAKKNADISNDRVYETMQDAAAIVPGHAQQIGEIVRMLHHFIEDKERHTLVGLVYEVMMQASGLYRSALADDADWARLYLSKFYAITLEYDMITRQASIGDFLEYLQYLSKFSVDIEEREEGNSVQVLTVHKSKGKEFPVVFIVDLANESFPLKYRSKKFTVPADLARGLKTGDNERALFIQEERRLLYVAMTRAEEHLYLTYSKRYGDNKKESKPSEFLEEVSYKDNPLISVIESPARDADLPVMDPTPIEALRTRLQGQAVRAISEMRLTSALQDLIKLERVRMFAERGTSEFDQEAFLANAGASAEIDAIMAPVHQSVVPTALTFSASALKTYQDCPLFYKFSYLFKIPTPPQAHMVFGTTIHSVIENLTKSPDPSRPLREQAMEILTGLWSSGPYQSKTQENEAWGSAPTLIDNYLSWQEANPNTVVAVEKEFYLTIGGRTIHGFIDRVEQAPNGDYVVIDYKSGKKPTDLTKKLVNEHIQLNLYCLAVQQLYGKLPERAEFFFLKDGNHPAYTPTAGTIKAFEATVSDLINGIITEQFPPRPEYMRCKGCAYGSLCESKETKGP
ncbi:MAG: UvrD-helicase domain-containing protein [Methanomicrobiales archaeon]